MPPSLNPDAPNHRPGRRVPANARRRVGHLAATWLGLTLGTVATVSALILWHLARRGRLIRENLAPPRIVKWDEIPPSPSPSPSPNPNPNSNPPAQRPPPT